MRLRRVPPGLQWTHDDASIQHIGTPGRILKFRLLEIDVNAAQEVIARSRNAANRRSRSRQTLGILPMLLATGFAWLVPHRTLLGGNDDAALAMRTERHAPTELCRLSI